MISGDRLNFRTLFSFLSEKMKRKLEQTEEEVHDKSFLQQSQLTALRIETRRLRRELDEKTKEIDSMK